MKPESSYIEKSDAGNRGVIRKLIATGTDLYTEGASAIKEGSAAWVRGTNKVREAGLQFLEAESVNPYEFKQHNNVTDWKKEAELRHQMTVAMRVARALPKPVETLEECRPVLQLMLIAVEDIAKPKRLEDQKAHEAPNRWHEFTGRILLLNHLAKELVAKEPFDHWTEFDLDKFVHNTEAIAEMHRQAQERLRTIKA